MIRQVLHQSQNQPLNMALYFVDTLKFAFYLTPLNYSILIVLVNIDKRS